MLPSVAIAEHFVQLLLLRENPLCDRLSYLVNIRTGWATEAQFRFQLRHTAGVRATKISQEILNSPLPLLMCWHNLDRKSYVGGTTLAKCVAALTR